MKKVSLLLMFVFVSSLFAVEKNSVPPPTLVVTTNIKKGIINSVQTSSGTLYYNKKSEIASEMEGIVKTFSFQEGEKIKKGKVLASLDSKILNANIMAKKSMIKAIQADVTRQEKELGRSKALLDRQSISQSNYDLVFYTTKQLQAQLQATKAELNAMQIQMQKTHIKAPFDCIVVQRNIEVGQWITRGSSIATLVDTQSIEARINIPADLLPNIHAKQTFLATIGAEKIKISLKNLIPLADESTRTFPLIFTIPKNKEFIGGMRIDIDVPTLKEEAHLLVPRDAVIKRFGQDVVFTMVEGKAVMYSVKIIGYKKDMVAIRAEGLKEEMSVVIKGNERIAPNMSLIEKVRS